MLSVNATVNFNITTIAKTKIDNPRFIKIAMRISAPNARIYKVFERYIPKDDLERQIMDYLKNGNYQILFKDLETNIGIERIKGDDLLLIEHRRMQLNIRVSQQEIRKMFEIEDEDDEHLARECAL